MTHPSGQHPQSQLQLRRGSSGGMGQSPRSNPHPTGQPTASQPTSSQPTGPQRPANLPDLQGTSGLPLSTMMTGAPLSSLGMRPMGAPFGLLQGQQLPPQLPQQLARPGGLPQMVAALPVGASGAMASPMLPFTAGMPLGFVDARQAWNALQMQQVQAMRPAGGQGTLSSSLIDSLVGKLVHVSPAV